MSVILPDKETAIWTQPNIGEIFGSIWASWNLDLISNRGRLKISPKTKIVADSDDGGLSALIKPVGFLRTAARGSDEWWALCNQGLFRTNANTDPTSTWIADATTNTPTTALSSLYSDLVEFSGNLLVTLKTDIARLVSGTWTADWWTGAGTLNQRALVNAIQHPLCVGFNNLTLIGDQVVLGDALGVKGQASIHIIDSASVVTINRLIFGKEFEVIWIKSSNSEYYIGCRNKINGQGKVFVWDGSSENFNFDYEIGSDRTWAGIIKDEVCHTINGNGQLMKYNGGGFTEVARLPVTDNKYEKWGDALATPAVHRNGMELINNKINILLDSRVGSLVMLENFLSGIWEYDEEMGLHHRVSISNNQSTDLDTGSPFIDLPGALKETSKDVSAFLAGCQVPTDNSTTIGVIVKFDTWTGSNIADSTTKAGYLITTQIRGSSVEETWQKLYPVFKKLANSTDRIIIKYRLAKKTFGSRSTDAAKACTWADSTSFTSASSQAWSGVAIGDEIEILSGKGAGFSAHITNIVDGGATFTITIDTTFPSASGTFLCRVNNWIQLDAISSQEIEWEDFDIDNESIWIQLKIYLIGKGDSPEVEKLIITSTAKTKAE